MKILVLSQFYPPEIGATQTRVHVLASGLAERGHDVTVVCEVPNHPQGVVRPGYRQPMVRRLMDGVHVVHVGVWVSPKKTTSSRLKFYGSYASAAVFAGAWFDHFDVIWASSPPLPVGAAAAILARRHRAPWVFDVRDLWPAAAAAMGELSNARALRVAERLEAWLYRDASAITAVTAPFIEHIAQRGGEPIVLLPNGTTEFWFGDAGSEPKRASPALFTWTFAGNIGRAQGLAAAVKAAAILGREFELILLGDGPDKERLQKLAAGSPHARVRFLPQVPATDARSALQVSDALLVSLSAAPELAPFVPSKLFDYTATGRPVVLAARGEAARLANTAQCAYVVPPDSPEALATALRRLADDSPLRQRLALAGPAFARRHLRSSLIPVLEQVLMRQVTSGR